MTTLGVAYGETVKVPPRVPLECPMGAARVRQLDVACLAKDQLETKFIYNMLEVAYIVSIIAATAFIPEAGLALACVYLLFSNPFVWVYEHFRSRDYINAAEALYEPPFHTYIADKNFSVSIENIRGIYRAYQQNQIGQAPQ